MKIFLAYLLALSLLGTLGALAQEQKKPPEKLVFSTKNGNVALDHATHVIRAKGDCTTCHDKLFKQDSKASLNYKPALHKTAETEKTSCGFCHHPGGPAFESKANCAKCHMKG